MLSYICFIYLHYCIRHHLLEITRAYVLYFPPPPATAASPPMFPNGQNINSHNSVNIRAGTLKFCIIVDIDIS